VTTRDTYRGHPMSYVDGAWRYNDTGQRVSDNPHRPCGHCGLSDTSEGHDGCLGTLPGVVNACCGHGDNRTAYVQFADGRPSLSGDDARRWQLSRTGESK
jgi:hypothetical protein